MTLRTLSAASLALLLWTGAPGHAAEREVTQNAATTNAPTIEILGVASMDPASPWRSVGGKPLAVSPIMPGMFPDSYEPDSFGFPKLYATPGPKEQGVRLLVEVHSLTPARGCSIDIPGHHVLTTRQLAQANGDSLYAVAAVLPQTAKSFTVRVGVTSVEWRDLAEGGTRDGSDSTSGTLPGPMGESRDVSVIFSPVSQFADGVGLTVTTSATDADTRIVGIDGTDNIVESQTRAAIGMNDFKQQTIVFPGVTLENFKHAKLQGRLFQWTEIKDVPLQPAK